MTEIDKKENKKEIKGKKNKAKGKTEKLNLSKTQLYYNALGIHVIHLKLQIGRFCFSNREND